MGYGRWARGGRAGLYRRESLLVAADLQRHIEVLVVCREIVEFELVREIADDPHDEVDVIVRLWGEHLLLGNLVAHRVAKVDLQACSNQST